MSRRLSDLGFEELRTANVERCEQVFHKLDDWSTADWSMAMGGEIGEALIAIGTWLNALNTAKKLRRLDGADADQDTYEERERLIDQIATEIADGVIYSDLLLAHLRRDLGEAIRAKFNLVSEKRGSTVGL